MERTEDDLLSAGKVMFGAEPKDIEVYDWILNEYHKVSFSSSLKAELKVAKSNPKKMQRDVSKALQNKGIGTKSQQALKLLLEQNKTERKVHRKEMKEIREQRKFELKQLKKKEKHKGR